MAPPHEEGSAVLTPKPLMGLSMNGGPMDWGRVTCGKPERGGQVERSQGQRGVAVNDGVFWQGGDPRWDAVRSITPLTRTIRADVCVVGGGFTGLWSALSLKKLAGELDVVLLEETYCGHGASGRNGGWLNAWDDILPTLTGLYGPS